MADDVGKTCTELHPTKTISVQHVHVYRIDGSFSHSINSKGDRL